MALSSRTGRGPSAVMQRSQVVEGGPRITRASKRFDCASRPPEPRHPNPDTHSCNRRPQMHTMCLISAPCPTRAHSPAPRHSHGARLTSLPFSKTRKSAPACRRGRARARSARVARPRGNHRSSLPPASPPSRRAAHLSVSSSGTPLSFSTTEASSTVMMHSALATEGGRPLLPAGSNSSLLGAQGAPLASGRRARVRHRVMSQTYKHFRSIAQHANSRRDGREAPGLPRRLSARDAATRGTSRQLLRVGHPSTCRRGQAHRELRGRGAVELQFAI